MNIPSAIAIADGLNIGAVNGGWLQSDFFIIFQPCSSVTPDRKSNL
jgi:hypothetical protein